MTLQALILILLKSSIFLNVFAIGLEASTSEAAYLFRRPGELVRAFFAVNVLMPLFAAILALVFNLNPAVEIALVALAISPIPPLIPRKVAKATSSGSYAIGLLIALGVLGRLEGYFEIKSLSMTYEVVGPTTDAILHELNRILDEENIDMEDVHAASIDGRSRVVFTARGVRPEQQALNIRLHQSSVFGSVQSLGAHEHE